MSDLEIEDQLFKEFNTRLLNIKKSLYSVGELDSLDNGQLEYELINLPNREYHARILIIHINRELEDLKPRIQRIIDNSARDIYQNPNLKNQMQRELGTRDLLYNSKLHMCLTSQKNTLEDTIYLLKAQSEYYAGMNNNLKKIYSIRNDILNSDKKIEKGLKL